MSIKHSEEFKREAARIALTRELLRARVAADLPAMKALIPAAQSMIDLLASCQVQYNPNERD
jgi:hypothetical protein